MSGKTTTRMSLREARARFSEVLRRVERGEEVVIERRGRAAVRLKAEPVETMPPTANGLRLGLWAGKWELPPDDALIGPDPDLTAAMEAWEARDL